MIQGTGSSVGKSLIVAGLCRIFKQDGYRVAPFKSQNMALNSYITTEGKEMGRAQAVQAEAAGIRPQVLMNPILLKPTSDQNAQVIIKGEVYQKMSAVGYHQFKPELFEMIKDCYQTLAEEYELIVLEGAGSPAEINLREHDLVNMGMAELIDAPVILVGDIDKGGVFASLVGTMMLLSESERKRVKGVIINKFRGDLELLKPGLDFLEDLLRIPVIGVLPYEKIELEEEDALAERFDKSQVALKGEVEIVVVKLPYMANFTDFDPLEHLPGVNLRYVERSGELGEPDLLILPGSKNTLADLFWLKEHGFEAQIKQLNAQKTIIIGICGGYQMLGEQISDPIQLESELLELDGFGLLKMKTVLATRKVTTQVQTVLTDCEGIMHGLTGLELTGYEIHHGVTEYSEAVVPFLQYQQVSDKISVQVAGVCDLAGKVFGTYLHGLFENTEFTLGLINQLRKLKGLGAIEGEALSYQAFKQSQYNKLAALLRKNLKLEEIYKIINE